MLYNFSQTPSQQTLTGFTTATSYPTFSQTPSQQTLTGFTTATSYPTFSQTPSQQTLTGFTTATSYPTSCTQSTPLSLVSVRKSQDKSGAGYDSTLHFTWNNCASQSVTFLMNGNPHVESYVYLKVTIITSGETSVVSAGVAPSTVTIGAKTQTTIDDPIVFYPQISPNAVIVNIAGNVTALDSVTGQALSQWITFHT